MDRIRASSVAAQSGLATRGGVGSDRWIALVIAAPLFAIALALLHKAITGPIYEPTTQQRVDDLIRVRDALENYHYVMGG